MLPEDEVDAKWLNLYKSFIKDVVDGATTVEHTWDGIVVNYRQMWTWFQRQLNALVEGKQIAEQLHILDKTYLYKCVSQYLQDRGDYTVCSHHRFSINEIVDLLYFLDDHLRSLFINSIDGEINSNLAISNRLQDLSGEDVSTEIARLEIINGQLRSFKQLILARKGA